MTPEQETTLVECKPALKRGARTSSFFRAPHYCASTRLRNVDVHRLIGDGYLAWVNRSKTAVVLTDFGRMARDEIMERRSAGH